MKRKTRKARLTVVVPFSDGRFAVGEIVKRRFEHLPYGRHEYELIFLIRFRDTFGKFVGDWIDTDEWYHLGSFRVLPLRSDTPAPIVHDWLEEHPLRPRGVPPRTWRRWH